jgi:hypothetical protein
MTMADEPTDADRALVQREIDRCRAIAVRADAERDQIRHQYYDGRATLLEQAPVALAVAFIRDETLRALAGRPAPGAPDAATGHGPTDRWMALWDLSYRTRATRNLINRQRAAMGLPPLVIKVLGVERDDW